MARFAKGDKVESVKTGAKGVVDEVYSDEKYAVLFDGATNPDRVEGFQIKAANGCARNAKFKVGDKIKVKGAGVETIKAVYPKGNGSGLDPTQVDMSVDWYETDGGGVISDEDIVGVANSASVRSANAVVQNAINARRARNAMVKIDDAEGAKRWDALWVKAAELKREAEALDKYLVSKKQYGYSAKLESLAKALTGF